MAKVARKAKRQQRAGGSSFARLTPYLRGIIYGLMLTGYSVDEIVDEVEEPDVSQPSPFAVRQSLQLSQEEGRMAWDGLAQTGGSRPKNITDAFDRATLRLVVKHRGKAKVTTEVRCRQLAT